MSAENATTGHKDGGRYEVAIRRFQEHLIKAEDGTFRLDPRVDARSLEIDPIVFADLTRSLAHTNELIRRGELKSSEIEFI